MDRRTVLRSTSEDQKSRVGISFVTFFFTEFVFLCGAEGGPLIEIFEIVNFFELKSRVGISLVTFFFTEFVFLCGAEGGPSIEIFILHWRNMSWEMFILMLKLVRILEMTFFEKDTP